jgi:hypothetical protein
VFVVVEQVFLHWVLIGLWDLFTDVVTFDKSFVLLLARVVQVRVEVKELTPSVVHFVEMSLGLLSDVYESFPRHRIIHHNSAAAFLPELVRKEV